MKKITFIFALFFVPLFYAMAQYDDFYESLLTEDEEDIESLAFKPIIGLGEGVVNFFGDVNNVYKNPFDGRYASMANVSRRINSFLDINFFFMYGSLTGNNSISDQLLNFETDLLSGGVSLTYNFKHLLKTNRPIQPFISIGIQPFSFSSKGDLYDANGIWYYPWSDGTLRDIMENAPNAHNSVILTRDYVYETKLRDEDYDGLGRYSQTSFALPIDFGIDLTVTDRMTMRIGNSYHYTFTDLIDDISIAGTEERKGNEANDAFLFTYVSFQFDLFSPIEEIAVVEGFKIVKYVITDGEDSDEDGVDDFNDKCPNTPPKITVDFIGCPIDEDADGIADYKDKQPNTPRDARAVGQDGVRTIDSELISLLYEPDAIDHKDAFKYYSGTEAQKAKTTTYTEIPGKFKSLDGDGDSYISIDELQKAINSLFDFSTNLSVDDINDLIDFFFEQ